MSLNDEAGEDYIRRSFNV